MSEPFVVAVLASGGGTNLQALIDAAGDNPTQLRVAAVITDRFGTGAAGRARMAGIPLVELDRTVVGRELSGVILASLPAGVDAIVLAGFLSIVGEPLLSRFEGAMINLHPSLLPRHGGPGMYGLRVHESVLACGDDESGCTVHFVDAGTDTGPILLQRRVPVLPGDTAEQLAARIAPVEHRAIVEAVQLISHEKTRRMAWSG